MGVGDIVRVRNPPQYLYGVVVSEYTGDGNIQLHKNAWTIEIANGLTLNTRAYWEDHLEIIEEAV